MCFLCILYCVRIYAMHYLYLWLTRLTYFFREASDVYFTMKQISECEITVVLLFPLKSPRHQDPWQLCRISADDSEVLTILLIAVSLAPQPADFRHLRPCAPLESTAIPQIQLCGVYSGAPRRRDTAMSMDVLSRRVSTEDIEMACWNAPEDCAAAAIRRARLAGVWATDNTASVAISSRGWLHVFWLAAIDESGVGVLVIDCHIFIQYL